MSETVSETLTGDYTSTVPETCPCCLGRKTQIRRDGIVIICPCYGGRGS